MTKFLNTLCENKNKDKADKQTQFRESSVYQMTNRLNQSTDHR